MATKVYNVRSPTGELIKVRGPEGASNEEVIAQAKRLGAGAPQSTPQGAVQPPVGPAPGVGGTTPQGTASAPPAPNATPPGPPDYSDIQGYNPNWLTDDMSGVDKFRAGAGSAFAKLGLGARQLYAKAAGTPEDEARLMAEAQDQRARTEPLEDTGAGFAGNIVGNVAAAAPALLAAPAGVPALIGAGALEGGVMGALAPETREGERAENMAWGAGIGGAIPIGGVATRKLVGEFDPVLQKAVETLKRYGVKASRGEAAPGALEGTGRKLAQNLPFVSDLMKGTYDKRRGTAAQALFKMLGKEAPTTNDEMALIVKEIGEDLAGVTKGKSADLYGIDTEINKVLSKYDDLLPSQQKAAVTKQANDILDKAVSGKKMTGEEYQAIRSELGAEAKAAQPNHAKALRGLQKALDERFASTLSPEEAAELTSKKAQYRLANALRSVDIKDGAVDLSRARAAVERTNKKGPVMPEARELLGAVENIIPKGKAGGGQNLGGTVGAGLALMNPAAVMKGLAIGAPMHFALRSGVPQKAASSPLMRKLTAGLLKARTQAELSDEE